MGRTSSSLHCRSNSRSEWYFSARARRLQAKLPTQWDSISQRTSLTCVSWWRWDRTIWSALWLHSDAEALSWILQTRSSCKRTSQCGTVDMFELLHRLVAKLDIISRIWRIASRWVCGFAPPILLCWCERSGLRRRRGEVGGGAGVYQQIRKRSHEPNDSRAAPAGRSSFDHSSRAD